ncbi:hypothetical protein FHU36_006416 [Nonomuraea muscovyensis]|uniref:Uncharacterized protein n=1 Tax=Nonomuraea muscovyensis TaxID=1124761 RepID=A0A7X0CA36_9ACTN|nr:hypothetical protein [Nonomuraea muscovyensis]
MAATRPVWASEMTSWTPGQAARCQAAQEGQPSGAVFGARHVQAEDLAAAVGVDSGGDQHVDVGDPPGLAHLLGEGVQPHERVGAGIERAGAEGFDLLIQGLGHL